MADVDGLYCNITEKIDAQLLDAGKKLKIVASMSVGFDHIDLEAATKRGIMATHTPGVLTEAVADETFGLMLAVARRLVEADAVRQGGHVEAQVEPDAAGREGRLREDPRDLRPRAGSGSPSRRGRRVSA